MKTKKIPFNIERAKAGAKVVTRGGCSVRIVDYAIKDKEHPILCLVDHGLYEIPETFTNEGRAVGYNVDSEYDLFIEEEEEETDYNPYKATVESIADMVERYADADSDLQDFYDNVKVKCKDAFEYDKKWCSNGDVTPKFKVGDKVVLKWDKSLVGSITSVSLEGTYSIKFENFGVCWYSEQELEPLHKVKKAKSLRRMTYRELSQWLRDCPNEFREFKQFEYVASGINYYISEADTPVNDSILIRRNYGKWEEPLIEE